MFTIKFQENHKNRLLIETQNILLLTVTGMDLDLSEYISES